MYNLDHIITTGIETVPATELSLQFADLYEWAVGDIRDGGGRDLYNEWNKRHETELSKPKSTNDKIMNTFNHAISFIAQAHMIKENKGFFDDSDLFSMWIWAFGEHNLDLMPGKLQELWKKNHPILEPLEVPETEMKFLESSVFSVSYVALQVVKQWIKIKGEKNEDN